VTGAYHAAIGSVTNLAFRLCAEASPGQILISPLQLKGFRRPVVTYEVVNLKRVGS